ncbi:hypothetical protein [Staphylococcus epidermidis]|uniref:hypothetical protein n=1 Tax=Staphylococcus epidermidis TaxID=1282 RepID=UPI00070F35D1|nr:hypothetical protein [Staphylococcus epidermidis]MBC2999088.1 hypothetical protein [Staphylococcus epidermidis]MBC3052539.1 hypothetical protein [Staphylococcus epidermidis]MBC3063684.1 hypothetical protein [Staphylococcus epidermidis]
MATLPKEVRQKLESNIHIYKVTSKNIYYTDDFKLKAVEEYNHGKEPEDIFRDAGIDVNIISQYRKENYIEGRLQKWNSQQINITDDISTTLEKESSEIAIYSKILSQGEYIIEELEKIEIEISKLDLNKEKYQSIIDLTKEEIIRAVNKI